MILYIEVNMTALAPLDNEFHENLFQLISEDKFGELYQALVQNQPRINFNYQKTIPSMLFGASTASLFSELTTRMSLNSLAEDKRLDFVRCVELLITNDSYFNTPNSLFNSSKRSSLSLLASVPVGLIPIEIYQLAIDQAASLDVEELNSTIRNPNKPLFDLMLKAMGKFNSSPSLTIIITQIEQNCRHEKSALEHRKQQYLEKALILKEMAIDLINGQREVSPKFLATAIRQICLSQNEKHDAMIFDICQAYFNKHFLTQHNQFHKSLTNIASVYFNTGVYEQHSQKPYFNKMQTLCEQSIYGHHAWLQERKKSDLYYELTLYLTLPDFVSFHQSGFYLGFQKVLEEKRQSIFADWVQLENSKEKAKAHPEDKEVLDVADENPVLGKRNFDEYQRPSTSFLKR